MEKLFIIIPVYKPDEHSLKQNIEVYGQVNNCIVLLYLNSSFSKDLFDVIKSLSNVILLGSEQNRGLAVAYNESIQFIKNNYGHKHYLLILDQDSHICAASIEELRGEYERLNSNNILLSCSVKSSRSRLIEKRHGSLDFFYIDKERIHECRGSGSFLSLLFFENKHFNELLMVDYVDWEFCWRYKKELTIRQSKITIKHSQGAYYPVLGGFLKVLSPSPVRLEIQSRSVMYLINQEYVHSFKKFQLVFRIFFFWPVKSLVYADRVKRLKHIFSPFF